MARKITFHFSDKELKNLARLVDLAGLSGVYGAEAKAIKFSITFALSQAVLWSKVLPDLEASETAFFLSSIRRLQSEEKRRLKLIELAKSEV